MNEPIKFIFLKKQQIFIAIFTTIKKVFEIIIW